jgi:hypothetical protein
MRIAALFLLCGLFWGGCSLNQNYIKTEFADKAGITGNFTVILYGANHYNDIATVAFLVRNDSGYTFDIFAPAFNYRVIKDLPAKDALDTAKRFVAWHPDFKESRISKILNYNSEIIGYEVRPLYMQTTFGREDVMYIDYFPKNKDKVVVHIKLYDDVERKLTSGGDGKDGGH